MCNSFPKSWKKDEKRGCHTFQYRTVRQERATPPGGRNNANTKEECSLPAMWGHDLLEAGVACLVISRFTHRFVGWAPPLVQTRASCPLPLRLLFISFLLFTPQAAPSFPRSGTSFSKLWYPLHLYPMPPSSSTVSLSFLVSNVPSSHGNHTLTSLHHTVV